MDEFDELTQGLDVDSDPDVTVFDASLTDTEIALKHYDIMQELHALHGTHDRNTTNPRVAELQSQLAACRREMRRRWIP